MEKGIDSPGSNQMQGRFMYSDYSPLEDDRNLVEIIKDFASLVSRIAKLDGNNRKLRSLLSDSDRLRADIIAAIKNIRTDTGYTMDKFYDQHADVLSNDLLTKGTALLLETKNTLSELLGSTESSFDEQHTKYREGILARINESNTIASNSIQNWLAGDYRVLPRPVLANLVMNISALIDRKEPSRKYEIRRTISASTITGSAERKDGSQLETLQFSYTFQIDSSDLEFWNHRRTVADLGIKDLMLPVGMKAPVSEKIKQTFRFGAWKDAEIVKQPEHVKVDSYHLLSAMLQADKTLVIELAEDAKPGDIDIFRITYDVGGFPDSLGRSSGQREAGNPAARPRIDYLSKGNGGNLSAASDLLQNKEIEKSSDMSKIQLLGSAVLSRIRALQDYKIVQSRGRLGELKIRDGDNIIPSAVQRGDFEGLFDFLESIASSFAPFVRRMAEKSPVRGELALREELGGGQRKEYSVRVDDLRSQLKETEYSGKVAAALGI
ncbi:MAG TPA: hypothetical protein VLA68_05595 [Nitrososphaera sp.]|nr:hypothetical protein [Nitrososphaera sp.]